MQKKYVWKSILHTFKIYLKIVHFLVQFSPLSVYVFYAMFSLIKIIFRDNRWTSYF